MGVLDRVAGHGVTVAALRRAKEGEPSARRIGHISEEAVTTRIRRRELARHCRSRTRGVEETTGLIGSLISLFDSESGKDTRRSSAGPPTNPAHMAGAGETCGLYP